MAAGGLGVQRGHRPGRRGLASGGARRAPPLPGTPSRSATRGSTPTARSIGTGRPSCEPNPNAASAPGRCVLLRPDIGATLPVFVVDHYEGFEARPSVRRPRPTRSSRRYLRANVEALRAAAGSHDPEIAFVGHGIPGAAIGRRALGPGDTSRRSTAATSSTRSGRRTATASSRARGSRPLARSSARAPRPWRGARSSCPRCGTSRASSRRASTWRRSARGLGAEALREVAASLDDDPRHGRGRPVIARRGGGARPRRAGTSRPIDALFERYDEDVPEPDAAARLRALAEQDASRSWGTSAS